MKQLDLGTLPDRILGMHRLETIFNQNGYLICQSSGERLYNFEDIVAIFIPLSPGSDQVVAVHSEYAKAFIQGLISNLH
ncbi:hypothetical protein [Desulfosporosinus sp. Sb-LF]|uniref:hypothetical protein n=1 Tax=Desulfosporosinus sp. Sb-LF TaxID=2560027 RepID=UPI00107FC9FA|nr:hypothetical protein [Desulfosporosinus sp. Sb-LF]TGE32426.1 hypothetical protein E4K68_12590 [Desulfosporosinus sp. Sb-LF]